MRGVYLLTEISSMPRKNCSITKEREWGGDWSGEVVFARPEEEILPQSEEEE